MRCGESLVQFIHRHKHVTLKFQIGDITKANVEAIVNAANERMLGGGGVDGAIHRAAGPELLRACLQVEEVRKGVRCPTGEARLTPGFGLPARFVIHTVGPFYRNAQTSAPLLRAAYESSFQLARQAKVRSVAFPAISCGVYGYPMKDAAVIAIQAARFAQSDFDEIRFVLFGEAAYEIWNAVHESF